MKSDYLWADQLPGTIDPNDYDSGEAVLAGLRVSQDRYSSISDLETFDAFFGGQSVGFGFNFFYESDNLRILAVQPNAPAAAAGLLRGDLVTAINDKAVATWISEGAMNEALGPSEPGITRKFTLTRGTNSLELTITKDTYALSYVLAQQLHEQNGRKIGYVNFYSFADPGVVPWRNALDNLIAQGAQDLIVDLRFNGGGLISTAAQIGSALGEQSLGSQPMTQLTFNAQKANANTTFPFRDDARAGRFDNLVWLTGGNTCSASEALILGIDAYRTATRIGGTTCGKPVGFTPERYNQKAFSIVTFRLENPNGQTDYFDGLAPDCEVTESGAGELGQPSDPLTAAALAFLATGSCPAASGASVSAKQADRNTNADLADPDADRYRFETMNNFR
jgi:C-terminal processing protease CtpA/Prc